MKDLAGMSFGRWTVLEFAGYRTYKNNPKKNPLWKCRCSCGNEKDIRETSLLDGTSKSCGCLMKERIKEVKSTHGGTNTRLFHVWDSMKRRCDNPNDKAYHNYGGRGIKVCDKWHDDFAAFREWAISTGYDENAKKGEFTIDRIDVNDMYCPENCEWKTMKEQARNRRDTIYLELNGVTRSLPEWSDISNVKYQTLWRRYSKGWSVERILKELI